MEQPRYKFPKIPHLPFSQNADDDDIFLSDISQFIGKEVVITEKVDGEGSTLARDFLHARSLDSKDHISRHFLKGVWGSLRYDIPQEWRLVGENVFAKHSIFYSKLPSYFLLFGIFDEKNMYAPWDFVLDFAKRYELITPYVIYRGIWDKEKVKSLYPFKSTYGADEPEGFVVRESGEFAYDDFASHICKFVRKNHVRSSDNWMYQPVVKNLLEK